MSLSLSLGAPPLSLALVGCGRWGRNVLQDLRQLGARVHVVDPSPDARRGARVLGAASTARDCEALPALDGAVVASSTTTHATAIEALASHGFPIFCEKPLTADPRRAQRLAKALPDRLFVMDKWRYHRAIAAMREIVEGGDWGDLLALETTRHQWGNPCSDIDAGWLLAPHDISIGLELMGRIPKVETAWGVPGRRGLDALTARLGRRPWMQLSVSTRAPRFERRVVVQLEDGLIEWRGDDAAALHCTRGRVGPTIGDADSIRRPIAVDAPLRRELSAFLAHLRGGPPPLSDARTGASIVSLVADMRTAALREVA